MDILLFVLVGNVEYEDGRFEGDSMKLNEKKLSDFLKNALNKLLNNFFYWNFSETGWVAGNWLRLYVLKLCVPVSQENIYKIYKAKHFMSYQETGKKNGHT